jgi:hypothetical protein
VYDFRRDQIFKRAADALEQRDVGGLRTYLAFSSKKFMQIGQDVTAGDSLLTYRDAGF